MMGSLERIQIFQVETCKTDIGLLVHEPRPENAPTGIIWVGKF